ncbi:ABC transporter ATP-binding protein, partial [Deinococcus pimensis]|uniref:ABC transporter ATP-binding protein n=1 Tax=Deinococcus pimensis TaxID=309888 RepID=UPI0005EB83F6
DEGSVRVHGRLRALLDLGAGFHPDLTGRENVYLGGVIGGLTRREVDARMHDIVEFAELAEFIDQPLRTYSSGMQLRLAFSVAAHTDPEVLLVDEVLAVGDLAFQRKCLERIARFREEGCTIVLVSHDTAQVRELCDEVVWLSGGRVRARGPAREVVDAYVTEMTERTRALTPRDHPDEELPNGTVLRAGHNRLGSLEARVTSVRLLSADGVPVSSVRAGDALRVEVRAEAQRDLHGAIVSVSVSREDGQVLYDASTADAALPLPNLRLGARVTLDLARLDLAGGTYYVDVGVHAPEWAHALDYHWHAYPLRVEAPQGGLLRPPSSWTVEADLVPAERGGPTR